MEFPLEAHTFKVHPNEHCLNSVHCPNLCHAQHLPCAHFPSEASIKTKFECGNNSNRLLNDTASFKILKSGLSPAQSMCNTLEDLCCSNAFAKPLSEILKNLDETQAQKKSIDTEVNQDHLKTNNLKMSMYPSPFSEMSESPCECEENMESTSISSLSNGKNKNNNCKRAKNEQTKTSLKFLPCFICGGNASGYHYGVNSCEACKGFFRRCVMRKNEFKCTKFGNCEIVNRNRGNCSACRLKKCLSLGMSKEKSKLGRYTSSKRTETIIEFHKLQGRCHSEFAKNEVGCSTKMIALQSHNFTSNADNIGLCPTSDSKSDNDASTPFPKDLIKTLVHAMDDIKPFGPNATTLAQIQNTLKYHYDRYSMKVKLYGPMKSVPKEDFYCLYKDFGIEIDGRMQYLRDETKILEDVIARYCKFAKEIPEFNKLSHKDQSNLLKASRCEFFIVAMYEGYDRDYQMFLCHNGLAYHLEEAADKFFSRELIVTICEIYYRWQKLCLSKEEKALICALTLVFTDRCTLENHNLVEKIQYFLIELLQNQLQKSNKESAKKRFMKIIDCLTLMRDGSELYLQEYKQLCKDKLVVEEVPMMSEFLLEDCCSSCITM